MTRLARMLNSFRLTLESWDHQHQRFSRSRDLARMRLVGLVEYKPGVAVKVNRHSVQPTEKGKQFLMVGPVIYREDLPYGWDENSY